MVVPDGVPEEWVEGAPGSIVFVRDQPPLSAAQLDELAGVVTGCAVAIAETGTIVLDHGPAQGRRALTLIRISIWLSSGRIRWRPTCRTPSGGWTRAGRRP